MLAAGIGCSWCHRFCLLFAAFVAFVVNLVVFVAVVDVALFDAVAGFAVTLVAVDQVTVAL